MNRRQMFYKLIIRALFLRKWRTLAAICILVLGTGVMLGMESVYTSMNNKMSKELQTYGANMIIAPVDKDSGITLSQVNQIQSKMPETKTVGFAPVVYGIGTLEHKPLVFAGIWPDQMKKVSSYWDVTGNWLSSREDLHQIMIGEGVSQLYDIDLGSKINLETKDHSPISLTVTGIVTSGSTEDNQAFISMALAEQLLHKSAADLIMTSVAENQTGLQQIGQRIETTFPTVSVKSVPQLVQVETLLLEKLHKLIFLIATLVLVTTVLTVMATMMSMITDRKKEIALKKALGASNFALGTEFFTEASVIALIGGTIGIAFSYFLAQFIGKAVFQSAILLDLVGIPWLYLGSLLMVGTAFLLTVKRIIQIEPMIVLKGK